MRGEAAVLADMLQPARGGKREIGEVTTILSEMMRLLPAVIHVLHISTSQALCPCVTHVFIRFTQE